MSRITYKEPGVMKEEGTMFGLSGSVASYGNTLMKGEGRLSFGTMDYTGADWDGTPLSINGIDDVMLELRGLVGKNLLGGEENKILQASYLYLYAGLGYRYLDDDSSTFDGGYERESNYFYIPIGIEAGKDMDNGWNVRGTLEYDLFLMGVQTSYLSDADPGYNDLTNIQDRGYGYRFSLSLKKQSNKTVFVIGPFVRYWNINESEEEDITYYGIWEGTGVEPKNNSTEIGIQIGLGF